MIIKLEKIINCSSEHPSYPASNLLQYRSNSSWRCAQPGCMAATVIFQLAESSCITGIDIGNYRSCVVIVVASTAAEPDNWIPVVNHQFLTHDEAVNGKFRDQVQIFTKKEINPDALKTKFDRIKVTCMQSANLKELFGLSFIVFKTEIKVDMGLDVFGRFKLKQEDKSDDSMDTFREKYMKQIGSAKKVDYKSELLSRIKQDGLNNFAKKQEIDKEPVKRPLLEKLEAGKTEEVFGSKGKDSKKSEENNGSLIDESIIPVAPSPADKAVKRTPFGDIIPSTPSTKDVKDTKRQSISKKRSLSPASDIAGPSNVKKPNKLPESTAKKKNAEVKKPGKPFSKLFEDVCFGLSGYVNPQRDEIRRKALEMGACYIPDVEKTNKKCTHLICAFKNTPKARKLKGKCKIVSHAFIEECYNEKKRFPWRRYALGTKDKAEPESEEEIAAVSAPINSPGKSPNVFEVETDPDSDSNY